MAAYNLHRSELPWIQPAYTLLILASIQIHYHLAKKDTRFSASFSPIQGLIVNVLIFEKALATEPSYY